MLRRPARALLHDEVAELAGLRAVPVLAAGLVVRAELLPAHRELAGPRLAPGRQPGARLVMRTGGEHVARLQSGRDRHILGQLK